MTAPPRPPSLISMHKGKIIVVCFLTRYSSSEQYSSLYSPMRCICLCTILYQLGVYRKKFVSFLPFEFYENAQLRKKKKLQIVCYCEVDV